MRGSRLREDLVVKGILFYQLDFFLKRGEKKIDIELDDLTHDSFKDYQRDKETIDWGYKVIRTSSSFYFSHKERVYRLLETIIENDYSPNDELVFIGQNHLDLDFQFDGNLIRLNDPMFIAKLRKFREKSEPRKLRTVEDCTVYRSLRQIAS